MKAHQTISPCAGSNISASVRLCDCNVCAQVDIDHTATELSIVKAILASDTLVRLVDELYFECAEMLQPTHALSAYTHAPFTGPSSHLCSQSLSLRRYHFTFDGLDFGWGGAKKTHGHTVDDALALMQALRRKGVRAHFWI